MELCLLGGFSLTFSGRPIHLSYDKGRAILVLLALETGRVFGRRELANLFWPDLPIDAARANLRLVLHDMRKALNHPSIVPSPLCIDRDSVKLNSVACLTVDALIFSKPQAFCYGLEDSERCITCLERMASLVDQYSGPLLAGFSLPNCQDFEEWLQGQREVIRARVLELLSHLSSCHAGIGAIDRALPFAYRFMEIEPWNEEGLRRLMCLLVQNGQSDLALRCYEKTCKRLGHDLAALPSQDSQILAKRIQHGDSLLGDCVSLILKSNERTGVVRSILNEQRMITVLSFGFTCLECEESSETLVHIQEINRQCEIIIRKQHGYPLRAFGGYLFGYFGSPQVAPKAALLAIRAALEISRNQGNFEQFEFRLGLHSGFVAVNADVSNPDPIGVVSSIAMRMQNRADPGDVIISDSTVRLVGQHIEYVALEERRQSGVRHFIEMFRVTGESEK